MENSPERTEKTRPIRTVISRGIVVEGDIEAGEDLRIEGAVKGHVHSTGEVTVEPSAVVENGIVAHRILIRGKVTGDVEATGRVDIDGGGRLHGNCTSASIRISEGAIFEGRSNVRKPS
ncbi:MAG: bactofilin family protein [Desulfobacterales bacterium]